MLLSGWTASQSTSVPLPSKAKLSCMIVSSWDSSNLQVCYIMAAGAERVRIGTQERDASRPSAQSDAHETHKRIRFYLQKLGLAGHGWTAPLENVQSIKAKGEDKSYIGTDALSHRGYTSMSTCMWGFSAPTSRLWLTSSRALIVMVVVVVVMGQGKGDCHSKAGVCHI